MSNEFLVTVAFKTKESAQFFIDDVKEYHSVVGPYIGVGEYETLEAEYHSDNFSE